MRDWRGPIAFVLAVGVAVALVAGFLTAELTSGPITSEEVSLLSTLAGAAIGAVATYLGVQHSNHNEGSSMQSETEAPERDEPVEPDPVPEPETPDERPEPTEPETPVEPERAPPVPDEPDEPDESEEADDADLEGMGP